MSYRMQVGSKDGISLQEAVGIISGFLPLDAISPEKTGYIHETEDDQSVIELQQNDHISLGTQPLPILSPLEIRGNGTTIVGNGGMGLILMASNTSIDDLVMDNFSTAVMINSHGQNISDISIKNCYFRRFTECSLMTGSDLSNGKISNVSIADCTFEGAPAPDVEGISDWFIAPIGIMLLAASGQDDADIHDCSIENVLIRNCTFKDRHRNSINTIPAAIATKSEKEVIHYSHDCSIRGLKIEGCNFRNAYDATINIMGSYMHNIGSVTEDVEISNCYLEYNIWGIYFCATEPCQGTVGETVVRNINVHHNELHLRSGGSGEDSAAFAIQCGRLDYADGAKANHGLVENIKVNDNIIYHTQHGIFLNAADSMVDGLDTEMIGNVIQNAEICRNRLYDVDDCFTFYGAQLEGRRVDIRIGIPPRTMNWLPLLEDHSVTTCTTKDNIIRNVICRDNYCTGYKFKYKIAGIKAGGHAYADNNRVAEDLVLENNTFENGEGHILVENQVIYDWVQAQNNFAPMRYRN